MFQHRNTWALRQAALAAMVACIGFAAEGSAAEDDINDPTVNGYRERQEQLVNASHAILASADAEKRELTTDEKNEIRENTAEVERLEGEIGLRMQVRRQSNRLDQPQPRKTSARSGEPLGDDDDEPQARPQAGQRTVIQTAHLPQRSAALRGNGGFRNLADFAQAVRRAVQGGGLDPRLANASLSTYGSEAVGADGGFAVPPDYRTEIVNMIEGEDSLMSRVDSVPTASNSVTMLVDETAAWHTSGVRVYSRAEAAAMTQSKPNLQDMTVRLNEIYALVPLTDELLEDAPMMSRLIATKAGEALQFKIAEYIVSGTGAGQPLGFLNSPSLVTVSKEGSQAAGTIHAKNVAKMWARMPARARSRAVWLANQDVEPALMELGFQIANPAGTTVTGGVPLYMPPGGLSAAPYGTLLGKPVISHEVMPTLGSVGDLVLAFMPGYFMPYKAGGIKSDVSMHLWFDQATTAFRWTFRFGGQPWLSKPIARKNGSNTLGHFIALEAR